MSKPITGIIPALITPYTKDGKVNHASIRLLIDALIKDGVKSFYVSGSTGEAFLQTVDERKAILETVTEHVSGRANVIFHTGAIATDQAVELAKFAETCEVSAISSLAPFYYKFSPKEIVDYYKAILDSCSYDMIVYNIPFLTGVSMYETCPELFAEKRVTGVKHTTSNFYELRLFKRDFPGLTVYSGFDEQAVAGLSMGADGLIGSTYNYQADKFIKIEQLLKAGKNEEALAMQDKANVSISAILEHGLYNSIKYLVEKKYQIDIGVSRKPFAPLSEESKKVLDKLEI